MKEINTTIESKKAGGMGGITDTVILVASAIIAKAMSTKIQVGGLIGAILLWLAIFIPLKLVVFGIRRLLLKALGDEQYQNIKKSLPGFMWFIVVVLVGIFVIGMSILMGGSVSVGLGGLIGTVVLVFIIFMIGKLIRLGFSKITFKVSNIKGYKNRLKFLGYFCLAWIGIIVLSIIVTKLFSNNLN